MELELNMQSDHDQVAGFRINTVPQLRLQEGLFKDRYVFKERICEGSYGKICRVIDIKNKTRQLVVKIQHDKE